MKYDDLVSLTKYANGLQEEIVDLRQQLAASEATIEGLREALKGIKNFVQSSNMWISKPSLVNYIDKALAGDKFPSFDGTNDHFREKSGDPK